MKRVALALVVAFGLSPLAKADHHFMHQTKAHEHSHMHHEHQQVKEEQRIIVINLTHDAGPQAVMATRFANVALSRGHEVVLWLNSYGVRLADAKAKKLDKSQEQARKNIQELLSKGGKVYVCPHCANMLGVKELIKGAEFAKPDAIFPIIADEKARIISL